MSRNEVNVFSGKSHIIFGAMLALALNSGISSFEAVDGAYILFGSLLPDIDHRRSILGRFNLMNRSRFCKHRGKCHTVLGSFLLSAPFYLFGGVRGLIFVFCGAVGHLCADKLYSFGKRKKPFAIRIW